MVLFAALFVGIGKPVTLPVVGDVLPDSAAAHAGLQANDRIDSIAGQPIDTFEDIQRIIADASGRDAADDHHTRRHQTAPSRRIPRSQDVGGQQVGLLGIRGGPGRVPATSACVPRCGAA